VLLCCYLGNGIGALVGAAASSGSVLANGLQFHTHLQTLLKSEYNLFKHSANKDSNI
jgi:hypothetical protein